MNKYILFIAFAAVSALVSGCASSKYGSAVEREKVDMAVENKPEVINYAMLKSQGPVLASRGQARGLPLPGGFVGSVVSFGSTAVKQMIDKEKKKYTAEWKQGLTDLYFYNQLSPEGPFDPVGMQFNGFRVVRTFAGNAVTDTALVADFELDTSNPYSIVNNSVFRLKLKRLVLNYSKAKVSPGENKLNIDFEITFTSSYVNGDGELFKNVELGKFFCRLRNAPLDKNAPEYAGYYKKLEGKSLEGWSFIVPRSFGYQITGAYKSEPAYSQGAYAVNVKVTESSKNTFVNELIIDNSGKVIDQLGTKVKSKFK